MVDRKCQEIAYFSSAMLRQKNAALVSVHIMLVIICSQSSKLSTLDIE